MAINFVVLTDGDSSSAIVSLVIDAWLDACKPETVPTPVQKPRTGLSMSCMSHIKQLCIMLPDYMYMHINFIYRSTCLLSVCMCALF